ncbi:transmembrane protein, putative (macronuclear) [Tetrahymena thermophila SB210]|uniref:Transmembrane protein, putative n=1 Tax=Tetrahymena thermophila (strain SB210) TaxID=312017 RepID=I7LWV1_TETTS|nr:transmembrane protein, putative [Tetrahymena thermophila SB210]EAS02914.2 transmembrane protein, putative [Tetrahymena thermophila SB210]|eukprot:XP_001023159.2 transmembrane protein, putative [Tetrahymena thermophila SB210]
MRDIKEISFLFLLLNLVDHLSALTLQINNIFSKNYIYCQQKSCSYIQSSLQDQPTTLLNYNNDILKYNECQANQPSCYLEFYLPFNLVNKQDCDSFCYNNQSFLTNEFQQNKQCNDLCFLRSYQDTIQTQEMQILNQFGDCLDKQNAFQNFDLSNDQVILDINQYQSCIGQTEQCQQYLQNQNLSSFASCFSYCSSRDFITQIFQSHLNSTQSCLNQILGITDSSSSQTINWDQFGLIVGVLCGALILLIAFYKFYLRKKHIQKKKEIEEKNNEAQKVTNNNLKYQNEDMEAANNENQKSPENLNSQEGQLKLNMINIDWTHSQSPKKLFSLNQNMQIDCSPTKFSNSREDTQNNLMKSQFMRSKIDTIFEEIEKERDVKKQKRQQKQEESEQELSKIQQRQANQFSINQTDYCQMLDQLRKNFQEVNENIKEQPILVQNNPALQSQNINKSNQKGKDIVCQIPSQVQQNEDEKEFDNKNTSQELDNNFAKNLQQFLQSVGLQVVQEQLSNKSSQQISGGNKSSTMQEKRVQNLNQKIEIQ